jgi:hypothetical protein
VAGRGAGRGVVDSVAGRSERPGADASGAGRGGGLLVALYKPALYKRMPLDGISGCARMEPAMKTLIAFFFGLALPALAQRQFTAAEFAAAVKADKEWTVTMYPDAAVETSELWKRMCALHAQHEKTDDPALYLPQMNSYLAMRAAAELGIAPAMKPTATPQATAPQQVQRPAAPAQTRRPGIDPSRIPSLAPAPPRTVEDELRAMRVQADLQEARRRSEEQARRMRERAEQYDRERRMRDEMRRAAEDAARNRR